MSTIDLKILAKDLTKTYPRSPRETLGGFVIAARTLDKCRAVIAGTAGEYHFDCPLDQQFLTFTGISALEFKALVATGATDEEVAAWIGKQSQVKDRSQIVVWNNKLRSTRLCDMPPERQAFLEDYIPKFIPKNRPVYVWFDVYDLEEERI
ncbi:MAG: DUF5069 domain-containing protein [Verrucomicrobia bacterium]|nr:DUF5069 domain-containing protein [Verrucomicrobiota bacterium]